MFSKFPANLTHKIKRIKSDRPLVTTTNQEVLETERKYTAQNYEPLPVALCKGKGVFVWDVEGNRYFDFLSGAMALNFGHSHPKILEALHGQSKVLHHVSRAFHSDVLGQYAKTITKKFGYEKVLPMNTGVEANDTAVKIARKWAYYKKGIPQYEAKIIVCKHNFMGRSITAISASTDPLVYEGYGPFLPGFEFIPFNDLPALKTAVGDPSVCAFFMEPILGDAGVIVPNEGYLQCVREICTEHNVLWIADEIQTGMGRTGKLVACGHEDVQPDVLTLGKSLGGGLYPVSAVLANDDVMNVITPGTHGSTFGGNPLASKVAMKALQVLEEERLAENACKLGELFRTLLIENLDKSVVLSVRGRGLLTGITIDKQVASGWDVCLKMRERGVLSKQTHGCRIRLAPPLVITETQLIEATERIIEAVNCFIAN